MKLPDIKAAAKKVPPLGWVIIAGIVLAVLYLSSKKGTGASTGVVSGGVGGGGGGGGFAPGDSPNNTVGTPAGGTPDVQTPGGTQSPLAGLPGAFLGANPTIQEIDLAQQPADVASAMSGLSDADQAYWASKLGGRLNVTNTYDPATLLARWLNRKQQGVVGTALTPQDVTTGLAYAKARATAAGVTPAELEQAQANIARYGDFAGYNDPSANAFTEALYSVGKLGVGSFSLEDTNRINAMPGGYTVENILALFGNTPTQSGQDGSPSVSSGATYDTQSAGRVTLLQQAIAKNTEYVRNLLADPTRTAAQEASLVSAQSKITSYGGELATLQPTKAF